VKVVEATATLNNPMLKDLTTLTNWKYDKVIWGSIDQREIYLYAVQIGYSRQKEKMDENRYERFLDQGIKAWKYWCILT
jgi:hypothetical protein